ncbi:MAG: hypothetical protein J4G06_05645 [Caldilineaceae bacterium]|nr:hypothetical protein [Caldilineaceae bacterium]
MNETDNLAGLVLQGLTALENGLSSLLLTSEDQARPDEGRTVRLQAIISEIDSYYGHDSRTFLLAHWALQLHLLLPTRACEPTLETTLCDLERLRELAEFFSLRDVADEIQDLADRLAAGSGGLTPFASVSGGFANLQDLTTATLHAIDERMEVLGGASFREAVATEVGLLEILASKELVGRYILDASQDRMRCCVCLATMVMVVRELLRMGETGSATAETADAQRLAQLGELVGITPVNARRNPLPRSPGGADREIPDTPAAAEPQADGGRDAVLFPDSEPAEPVKRQPAAEPEDQGDLTVDVAFRHLPEPPPPEPEWEPEPLPEDGTTRVEPDTEPDIVDARDAPEEPEAEDPDAEIAEALAETEAPGQGLGQMLLMVLMVLVGVGIVALVVVRPAWLDNLANQGGIDGAQAITPEPEESVATAVPTTTEIPLQAVEDVEEPAEPTPVPPTPTSTPVAGYVFLATTAQVYRWPDVAADTIDPPREADSGVILARRVADGDQIWLQMADTFFILAETVTNPEVVDQLPLIDKADIPNIPVEYLQTEAPADEPADDTGEQDPAEPTPESIPDDRTTIVEDVDVHIGPGADFESRGILPAGREVNLLGTSTDGSWSLMDDFHWIPSAAITNIPDGLPVLRHPTTISNANLRAAPNSGSAQQGFLGPGTALLLDGWTLGSNPDGVWYHLDSGEWIWGDLVQDAYAGLPERPYVPDEQ